MDTKFAFLLLHYKNADVTMECINSIMKEEKDEKYDIVVVDNASKNGSIEQLKLDYQDEKNIHFIQNEDNLGYARGNNIGFAYAKNVLHSNFICLANNDIIFQKECISKIVELYEKEHYYVLGPDVLTPNGQHQNPFRSSVATSSVVLKKIVHDAMVLASINLGVHSLISRRLQKQEKKMSPEWETSICNFQGVLHGSCLVFSPLFINQFDGFYKGTFLYVEEDILCYILHKLNCKYMYSSQVQVIHCHATTFKRKIYDENKRKKVMVGYRIHSYIKFLKITLKGKKVAHFLMS